MKRSKKILWLTLVLGALVCGQAQAETCDCGSVDLTCSGVGDNGCDACADNPCELSCAVSNKEATVCLTGTEPYTMSSPLKPGADLTLKGIPHATLHGDDTFGFISVENTSLTLDRVTINRFGRSQGGAINFSTGDTKSTLKILSSTLSHNSATSNGGAVSFSIGGYSNVSSSLTIQNSTLSGNIAKGKGGAVYFNSDGNTSTLSLTIQNSTLSDNGASDGGAVYFTLSGYTPATPSFIVQDSTLSRNIAKSNGGAVYLSASGNHADTTLTIQNSTWSDNRAGNGGAVYFTLGGYTPTTSNLTFQDSTLSRNIAKSNGGAVYLSASGNNADTTLTVQGSTWSANRAKSDGGAVYFTTGGYSGTPTLTFQNSILKGGSLCTGSSYFTSNGNNLVSDETCGYDKNKKDSLCADSSCGVSGTLVRNGGATQVLPLLENSQALQAGSCDAGSKDQRGVPRGYSYCFGRPKCKTCDIGAYESVCHADSNGDATLDIYLAVDFHHPAEDGSYTIMNSSYCQIDRFFPGTTEIQVSVKPVTGEAPKVVPPGSRPRLQIYNVYFHRNCHASAAGTHCSPPPQAGKYPADCSDCIIPCFFSSASAESLGAVDVRAISSTGTPLYRITGLTALGGGDFEAQTCPEPPPSAPTSCEQVSPPPQDTDACAPPGSHLSCTCIPDGVSWWYTVQWSEAAVHQGDWDPRMECQSEVGKTGHR